MADAGEIGIDISESITWEVLRMLRDKFERTPTLFTKRNPR
jgi:hypothetical protein